MKILLAISILVSFSSCIRIVGIKTVEYFDNGQVSMKRFDIEDKSSSINKNFLRFTYYESGQLRHKYRYVGTVIPKVCAKSKKMISKVYDEEGNLTKKRISR